MPCKWTGQPKAVGRKDPIAPKDAKPQGKKPQGKKKGGK